MENHNNVSTGVLMLRSLLVVLILLGLMSCGGKTLSSSSGELVLSPVHYRDILGWEKDDHTQAFAAFLQSCRAFEQLPDGSATGQGELLAPAVVWKTVCRQAQLVPSGDETLTKLFFEKSFVAFRASDGNSPVGLFTGYYEPSLMGSRTQHRPFVYPIYALPPQGTPSYSREQIDLGMLADKAPVIAYVDDPVQRFFLHVQGSGQIRLDDGGMLRVGYAGTNGLPYVSIGKVLADKGLLAKDKITMPLLRQWLYDHPNEMWQVMWEDPSYIFFHEVSDGPIGSEKVPLTPIRSLAVDARYIPLGMPVFVDTVLPDSPAGPMAVHRKLMIAQDTGSAIRGPVRGDIFFGAGPAAEQLAGRMKEGGEYTLLVPRALAKELFH